MATKVDISTRFMGDHGDLIRSIEIVNKKLEAQAKTVRRSRRDWRQFTQNAIFGVEDVASTVGTGGLAGAVRAASNNMTMMLMAVGGPWMTAFGVAAAATLQLALALDLFGESADKAAEKAKKLLDDYVKGLKEGMRQQETIHNFNRRILDGTIEQRKAALEGLQEQIAAEKSVLEYLQKNLKLRQQSRDALLAEAKARAAAAEATLETGVAGKGRKAVREGQAQAKRDAAEMERKRVAAIEAEITAHEAKLEKLREMEQWAEGQTRDDEARAELAEREKQRTKEIADKIKMIGEMEAFRLSLAEKNKTQIEDQIKAEEDKLAVIEKQLATLRTVHEDLRPEGMQQDLTNQQFEAERRITIAKEAQKTAAEETLKVQRQINQELRSSVDGSMEFAKAFQKVIAPEMGELKSPEELLDEPLVPFGGKYKEKSGFSGKFRERGKTDIDRFTKARDAKREKEAKEMKETASNTKKSAEHTKMANDLLSRIADRMESGTSLEVTVGGVLS